MATLLTAFFYLFALGAFALTAIDIVDRLTR